MKRTIRRYRLGYALGATLCFIGVVALSAALWKAWPSVSSNSDPIRTFWDFLWTEQLGNVAGVELKPLFLIILAAAALASAAAVFAFSRKWFSLPGAAMRLRCPFCKKRWQASYNAGQVLCPHCRHLVHPKMVEK